MCARHLPSRPQQYNGRAWCEKDKRCVPWVCSLLLARTALVLQGPQRPRPSAAPVASPVDKLRSAHKKVAFLCLRGLVYTSREAVPACTGYIARHITRGGREREKESHRRRRGNTSRTHTGQQYCGRMEACLGLFHQRTPPLPSLCCRRLRFANFPFHHCLARSLRNLGIMVVFARPMSFQDHSL